MIHFLDDAATTLRPTNRTRPPTCLLFSLLSSSRIHNDRTNTDSLPPLDYPLARQSSFFYRIIDDYCSQLTVLPVCPTSEIVLFRAQPVSPKSRRSRIDPEKRKKGDAQSPFPSLFGKHHCRHTTRALCGFALSDSFPHWPCSSCVAPRCAASSVRRIGNRNRRRSWFHKGLSQSCAKVVPQRSLFSIPHLIAVFPFLFLGRLPLLGANVIVLFLESSL